MALTSGRSINKLHHFKGSKNITVKQTDRHRKLKQRTLSLPPDVWIIRGAVQYMSPPVEGPAAVGGAVE